MEVSVIEKAQFLAKCIDEYGAHVIIPPHIHRKNSGWYAYLQLRYTQELIIAEIKIRENSFMTTKTIYKTTGFSVNGTPLLSLAASS